MGWEEEKPISHTADELLSLINSLPTDKQEQVKTYIKFVLSQQ